MTKLPIRLLLVDDHAAFRLPLALILEREPDLVVAAQAGSLAEARAQLPEITRRIDVALVDLQLPDGNGVEFVRDLRAANSQGQTIVVTADTEKLHHACAIEAGAVGVISKSAQPSAIIHAIRRVHAGEMAQPVQEIVELLRVMEWRREQDWSAQAAIDRLTPREREVLVALSCGLTDREIAERLYISTETARTHMVNILHKLDMNSRLQAAIFAIRHGIDSSS